MHTVLIALISLFFSFHHHLARAATLEKKSNGVRTVYQFPNGTWLENIAVRTNGQLLLSFLTAPDLYQIDPSTSEAPVLIHRFPGTGTLGIAEIDQDVFAVAAGNVTVTATIPGTYSVWKVDMRTFDASSGSPATVAKIADIPEAQILNGATLLNQGSGIVLFADSIAGVVWGLDTRTGEYDKVLDDPLMKPGAGPTSIGINGIRARNSSVYFTNSAQIVLARVPVHAANGTAAGAFEVVARPNASFVDDFALRPKDAAAFVATNHDNSLLEVYTAGEKAGMSRVVEGSMDSTVFTGTTAAAFGRTVSDRGVLYVTTSGAVNGSFVEGARVLAVDTAMLD